MMELEASTALSFQCNLCSVQIAHSSFLWGWEGLSSVSSAQLCHQPSHVSLGRSLPSLDLGCEGPFSRQLKPDLSTWIPFPVPALLGTVRSRGWSRTGAALVSIQVSHKVLHKLSHLGPGLRHTNQSVFTPASLL